MDKIDMERGGVEFPMWRQKVKNRKQVEVRNGNHKQKLGKRNARPRKFPFE